LTTRRGEEEGDVADGLLRRADDEAPAEGDDVESRPDGEAAEGEDAEEWSMERLERFERRAEEETLAAGEDLDLDASLDEGEGLALEDGVRSGVPEREPGLEAEEEEGTTWADGWEGRNGEED
jgi:hypothetical protein